MTGEVLTFLGGDPGRIALFEAMEAAVLACGESTMAVSKSQISWGNPKKFAFFSLHHAPQGCAVATFGLGRRVDAPQIWQAVEPYPNRWTHHVLLAAPADVTPALGGWLKEAYTFAQAKGRRRAAVP